MLCNVYCLMCVGFGVGRCASFVVCCFLYAGCCCYVLFAVVCCMLRVRVSSSVVRCVLFAVVGFTRVVRGLLFVVCCCVVCVMCRCLVFVVWCLVFVACCLLCVVCCLLLPGVAWRLSLCVACCMLVLVVG